MSTELIINASLPETRIALVENGEIQDLVIERPSDKGIVGNIYKGRVTRVLPGMQAAFVDIGLDKAAFLYVDEVYVHQNVFEEEASQAEAAASEAQTTLAGLNEAEAGQAAGESQSSAEPAADHAESAESDVGQNEPAIEASSSESESAEDAMPEAESAEDSSESEDSKEEETNDESDDDSQAEMLAAGESASDSETEEAGNDAEDAQPAAPGEEGAQAAAGEGAQAATDANGQPQGGNIRFQRDSRRHRRGRRGGRGRRRHQQDRDTNAAQLPQGYEAQMADSGTVVSDRAAIGEESSAAGADSNKRGGGQGRGPQGQGRRPEFREQRSRDRRVRPKSMMRPSRGQVNIQDLLQEGQEVLVQVAKDPIATKGARLTCHISLPGRHLVCMPTIDHVGVSRRIDRDDERRKLRDLVERFRPQNLGFIVRTASASGKNSEKRVRQDIDYLANLWGEIRENSTSVSAPALVYEDLNPILRAIRDWVNEDIDKIVVDSRYHYNEILKFVSHFMPVLKSKVELYHGDIPVFDAYNISTELSRSLERRVWLKSGGYIMIDQAEALVAIDVNTGRFVGKRNLEDTILKTNLEAVQEIAYQLRLRNCGGIIILDLIDMEKEENRHRVYRALDEALKRDRARPTIQKISDLGLIEMTRKRTRDTMVRTLCEPCSHCEGKGFVKSKVTVSYEVLREIEREGIERDVGKILVQAHADVIDILAIDHRDTLDALERRYRKQIYLQAVTDYHVEQFEVFSEKKENQRKMRDDQQRRHQQNNRHSGGERNEHRRDEQRRDRSKDNRQERQGENQSGPEYEELQSQRARAAASLEEASAGGGSDSRGNEGAQDSSAQPNQSAENLGNRSDAEMNTGDSMPMGQPRGDDEDFSEEDRLAFLRAQAAQDAALARTSGNAVPGRSQGQGGGGGGSGGHGGGGGRRGRGNHRRGGQGGGKNFGGRGGHGGGGGGKRGGGQWNRNQGGQGGDRSQQQPRNDAKRDNRSDDEGGGGDRSPPPANT